MTTVRAIDDALRSSQKIAISHKYTSGTVTVGRFASCWGPTGLDSGSIPPAATSVSAPLGAALSAATQGAAPLRNAAVGKRLYIAKARMMNVVVQTSGWGNGAQLIVDRLVQIGPITNAAPFTTGTPTLPRYTNGVGVGMWVEATGGGSTPTISASYTNSDGVAGRTATIPALANIPCDLMPVTLEGNDRGVRSVESVTVGGVGSCNIVLGYTLTSINLLHNDDADRDFQQLGLPAVENDACLWFPNLVSTNNIFGAVFGFIEIIELAT